MVRELKHTEIGDIPVDWELQTFDETFRVISNNTLSRENLNNRGGAVRNIHYGDILTKFPEVSDCNEEEIPYVNELSLLSSSTQLLQDGDIVVADTAEDETVGKVIEVQNLGDSKLVAGLHTIPCRVKKGEFAPGWLGYYMNSDLFHNQILPYITGIKVSSISKGAISETLILVPPFDEQEKIVQSLNKIQLLMTAETKVVNKIKLVKNGCLSKMFPQKDDTVPEMRLPGFTETWEQRKVSEIGNIVTGSTPKTSISDNYGGEFLFVSPADIQENRYVDETITTLTKKGFDQGRKIREKASLFVSIGSTIGKVAQTSQESTTNQQINAVEPYDNFDDDFIFTSLENISGSIKAIASNQAVPIVNKTTFGETEIKVPSELAEQQKIGAYFRNLDHLITLHQRKCEELQKLKKFMLQNMYV